MVKEKPYCKICGSENVRLEKLFADGRSDLWCLDEECGYYGHWPYIRKKQEKSKKNLTVLKSVL